MEHDDMGWHQLRPQLGATVKNGDFSTKNLYKLF